MPKGPLLHEVWDLLCLPSSSQTLPELRAGESWGQHWAPKVTFVQ